jgi:arabinogalactan endo-1,4-beta-galactosidase
MLRSALLAVTAVLSNVAYGALTYKGADLSSLIMLENQGKTFKTTSGVTQPLEGM